MTVTAKRSLSKMAAVVIGRNEGGRLQPSLRSVQAAGLPLVYCDSGSDDGSPAMARAMGIPVVDLDSSSPFSAGRGRNEGVDEVLRRWPSTPFTMFLDGDCTLDEAFPLAAEEVFDADASCAIVTGHLAERFPERSVYNRLCAFEWRSPAGRMTNMNSLGGIMAIRLSAFKEVGGFHLDAIAGEEPDLGARLMARGFSIIKIDTSMAVHDADMRRFSQWWKRAVRGGHAVAYRYDRHGQSEGRDGRREMISDLLWGLAIPVVACSLAWATKGLSLLLLAGYGLLFARVFRSYRKQGLVSRDARLVSRFIIYSKFAHVVGIVKYCLNRARGEFRIIEYK